MRIIKVLAVLIVLLRVSVCEAGVRPSGCEWDLYIGPLET